MADLKSAAFGRVGSTPTCRTKERKMKLYDVPRNTRIKVGDRELNFHRIDGAYSYCTTDKGEPVHLAAWTEVEIVEEKK